MPTEVVLTGVGYPSVDADRAGPGVLIRHGDLALQFDAGRATTMRLAKAGVRPQHLDALFLTHHHSDHLTGVDDLLLSRWIASGYADHPLAVVAPAGPCVRFTEHVLDVWADDIDVRSRHVGAEARPSVRIVPFEPERGARPVWSGGGVEVHSFLVRHDPVVPSVGYRVHTDDGVVVISGDTCVCPEVADAARGANVVVHEVIRDMPGTRPTVAYHANSVQLGRQAAEVGVPTLVLTHLIPMVRSADDVQRFADEVRSGGFDATLVVGDDMTAVTL